MENNVQLKPKPSAALNAPTRSQNPSSTRHESIAYVKGGVPIKRVTVVSPARPPPAPRARPDPARARGKNFGSSKQASMPTMPSKPVQKAPAHPILKKGSSTSLQQNPYPMRALALAKREMSTKELLLYRGQVTQDESSENLSKSSRTSMIHHVRNPLSSCNLHRTLSRSRKLGSADEIILHHTNPFLEDLILQKHLKSVQSVHVQTEDVPNYPNYSPLPNHSQSSGPGQQVSIVGHTSGQDLASLLPSNEKLSLGRSEQIYSWIPPPHHGHGQREGAGGGNAPLDSDPPPPLLRYLDPLIHKTPPSYRLDPDLSRVPDFWDKPPTPPPNLPDCFVDSKSMDAFMTHVLGGARAGRSNSSHTGRSYGRLRNNHQRSESSNSLQAEEGHNSQSPILPGPDVDVYKVRPQSSSTESIRGSPPEIVTADTPGIQITFNYSPGYDWEADKHFHKRSAYFPRLFGRNSSSGEKSKNFAPDPTPERGNLEEAAASATTSGSLPVLESRTSNSTSSTSADSHASAPGIRNVILDKFLLEIPPYSVPQDKTSSLVSESSSRTYTKEGDTTPLSPCENYAVQIEISPPENERVQIVATHPSQSQNAKDNIFIGTISEEELQLDTDGNTEARPSIHLTLQSELEHWSKALLDQPALAYELNQALGPELTLGQRICAIIDMSNDKSSRLGLQLKDELLQRLNGGHGGLLGSRDGNNANEAVGSDAKSTASTYTLSPRGHRVHFDDSEPDMAQAQDKQDKQSLKQSHSYVVTPRSRHDIHNMHCSAGSEYAMLTAAVATAIREQEEERGRSRSPSAGPRAAASRSRSTPSQSAIHKVLVRIQNSASRMTTPRVPAVVASRRSRTSVASGSASGQQQQQQRRDGDRDRERQQRPSSQQQRRP